MKMISSALALGLLATLGTAADSRADRPSPRRSSLDSAGAELLELRNEWRRDVRFTVSRVDGSDPYEFRLDRADRARRGRASLSVGPVAPGRSVSLVVSAGDRVSARDLLGQVKVTVRADDRRGRVLDAYLLPVDLRRRGDRDHRRDRYDRYDRYDRHDRDRRDSRDDKACRADRDRRRDRDWRHDRVDRQGRDHRLSDWERAHRGHRHARGEVCRHDNRTLYRRPMVARDLLRFVIASRQRD